LETFKYLFAKISYSEANDTPLQLDWEFDETGGGVHKDTSSLQGTR